jgi:hypothetical protein
MGRLVKFCLISAATSVTVGATSFEAQASFIKDLVKQVTAPVKLIAQGKINELPNALINVVSGPVTASAINKVADAVGGPIGQIAKDANRAGPLATQNLANVQFLQAVVAIKALKAGGIVKDNATCRALASQVAVVAAQVGDIPELKGMAQDVGEAACDTATPAEIAASPQTVSAPSGQAQAALGAQTGFAGLNYQVRPIASCIVGAVPPLIQPGPFYLMSDLKAAWWNPAGNWIPVAQLYSDITGHWMLRAPLPDPNFQMAVAVNGDLFFVRAFDGAQLSPTAIGHCG